MERPVDQTESPYEAARRVNNVARLGTVAQVRLKPRPARCRVRTGGLLTNWIPWFALRAGGAKGGRLWSPPVVGEQVMMLAPGGDLNQAVVLPGVYSDDMPQGSEEAGVFLLEFDETSSIEFLPRKHLKMGFNTGGTTLTMEDDRFELKLGETKITMNSESIQMNAGSGTLTLDSSGVRGEPDVISGLISLINHLTSGVMVGPLISGPPVP